MKQLTTLLLLIMVIGCKKEDNQPQALTVPTPSPITKITNTDLIGTWKTSNWFINTSNDTIRGIIDFYKDQSITYNFECTAKGSYKISNDSLYINWKSNQCNQSTISYSNIKISNDTLYGRNSINYYVRICYK